MINTRKNDEGCAISPRLRHLKPTARVLLLVHYFPICSCRFTRGEYGCGHQQPAPSTIRLSALRSSPSRSGISPNTSPGLTMFKGFLSRPTAAPACRRSGWPHAGTSIRTRRGSPGQRAGSSALRQPVSTTNLSCGLPASDRACFEASHARNGEPPPRRPGLHRLLRPRPCGGHRRLSGA